MLFAQSTETHKAWLADLMDYIDNGTMLTNPPSIKGMALGNKYLTLMSGVIAWRSQSP